MLFYEIFIVFAEQITGGISPVSFQNLV